MSMENNRVIPFQALRDNYIYCLDVSVLPLPRRVLLYLHNERRFHVSDLITCSERDIRNIGKQAVEDTKKVLSELGLQLGTAIEGYPGTFSEEVEGLQNRWKKTLSDIERLAFFGVTEFGKEEVLGRSAKDFLEVAHNILAANEAKPYLDAMPNQHQRTIFEICLRNPQESRQDIADNFGTHRSVVDQHVERGVTRFRGAITDNVVRRLALV